jgi:hypothetical protein
MRRIKNREGGGALALHGCRFNNKHNNQPKVGIIGGDNIQEGSNMWEGRYPINWGG